MKASRLIIELTRHISKHGDLPVRFEYGEKDADVGPIAVYDEDGQHPNKTAPAEIYLHRAWGK